MAEKRAWNPRGASFGGDHRDVGGELGVQRLRESLWRWAPSASRLATCPRRVHACIGAAGYGQAVPARQTASSASRKAPSTVRSPGCRAHPRKPVPSYSSVSRRVATVSVQARSLDGSTSSTRPSTAVTTTSSPGAPPAGRAPPTPRRRASPGREAPANGRRPPSSRRTSRCRPWRAGASTSGRRTPSPPRRSRSRRRSRRCPTAPGAR